ncbi:MAG: hypothetical protein PHF11_03525 [Candidatus Omnitrophica bacterium]|nr:hypothetical protein [Candidatus Omnitrophota bacterium]
MQDKKLKGLLVISVLFAATFFFYKDVIFLKDRILSQLGTDIYNGVFPADHLIFSRWPNMKMNLWNPYIFLGQPLINHPGNALFYPLNIIFFFLPLQLAINYSFFLNTLLSGIAVYLYIRYLGLDRFSSLVGAAIFMFSAFPMLHLYAGHLQPLQTLPWIALLFLCTEVFLRKGRLTAVIFGGLVLGIQILAGMAQYTFYTICAVSAYFLFFSFRGYLEHKITRRLVFYALGWALLIIIGFGIAAVKLIPSMEFVSLSDRGVTGLSFAASWSFSPSNLITYIFPEFYGNMVDFPYWGHNSPLFWEMCGYVGVLPLILSVIAVIYRRNKYTLFFAGLSVVALSVALGAHTPVFKIFYYFLPGFSKFRGHSKIIILVTFSVSVLSAYGLNWLSEIKSAQKKYFKRIVWSLGIVAALSALLAVLLNFNNRIALGRWARLCWVNNWPLDFMPGSLSCVLFSYFKFSFFIVAGFLALFYWFNNRLPVRIFKFFILALIIADLWLFGSKFIVANPLDDCYWDRKIVGFLKDKGALYSYRVMSPHIDGPWPNKAWLDGIHMVDGYDAIVLKRFPDLFNLCGIEPIDSARNVKLLSMANLKFLVMPKNVRLNNPDLSPAYETGDIRIWENSGCLPRAYLVHGAKIIKDDKDRIAAILFDKHFDASRTVILEEGVALSTGVEGLAQQPDEAVKFLKYGNNEVVIRALLKRDGYLILSDFNYPGWRVDILNLGTGGRRQVAPLYANHIFRAVALKSGEYSVRFVFRPQTFYTGLKISVFTMFASLAALVLIYLKAKKCKTLKA